MTLEAVQQVLASYASRAGISLSFRREQIKSGGLFNSRMEDCVIVYHPDHMKDYFSFCIKITRQDDFIIVFVKEMGQSKQMDKAYRSELTKQGVKCYIHAGVEDYETMGKSRGTAIGGALGSIGKSKKKLEEEKAYYQIVYSAFDEIIS